MSIEVILYAICFFCPHRWALRIATIVATIVFTWSIINAGWMLRTGKQFLPLEFFPLIRDPFTTLAIIVVNLIKMPLPALIFACPIALAIAFLTAVLIKPKRQ
jgi:hypothetical protein